MLPVSEASCSAGFEVLVPGGGASTKKHHNDSIEPEVKTVTQSLWVPHVSESTGKEQSSCAGWDNSS